MSKPVLPATALDHVGIAVRSPHDHPLVEALGGEVEGTVMPSGVVVGRFGPEQALELVWPGREGTPIDGFLDRRGPGLHHIALAVREPLAELAERLRAAGLEPVGQIERSSDGRPSLFLHPSGTGGVLIELVETL
ncbi:MAG TPA: VOC family protein [Gaiellaceae bacterium]|nr:VOC family protein [Gaiellaceae bacterium]